MRRSLRVAAAAAAVSLTIAAPASFAGVPTACAQPPTESCALVAALGLQCQVGDRVYVAVVGVDPLPLSLTGTGKALCRGSVASCSGIVCVDSVPVEESAALGCDLQAGLIAVCFTLPDGLTQTAEQIIAAVEDLLDPGSDAADLCALDVPLLYVTSDGTHAC